MYVCIGWLWASQNMIRDCVHFVKLQADRTLFTLHASPPLTPHVQCWRRRANFARMPHVSQHWTWGWGGGLACKGKIARSAWSLKLHKVNTPIGLNPFRCTRAKVSINLFLQPTALANKYITWHVLLQLCWCMFCSQASIARYRCLLIYSLNRSLVECSMRLWKGPPVGHKSRRAIYCESFFVSCIRKMRPLAYSRLHCVRGAKLNYRLGHSTFASNKKLAKQCSHCDIWASGFGISLRSALAQTPALTEPLTVVFSASSDGWCKGCAPSSWNRKGSL